MENVRICQGKSENIMEGPKQASGNIKSSLVSGISMLPSIPPWRIISASPRNMTLIVWPPRPSLNALTYLLINKFDLLSLSLKPGLMVVVFCQLTRPEPIGSRTSENFNLLLDLQRNFDRVYTPSDKVWSPTANILIHLKTLFSWHIHHSPDC